MLVNNLSAGVFVMVMAMTMLMTMMTLMMAFIFVNHVCGRSPQVGGARSEKSKSGSNKRESSRLLNNFVSFLAVQDSSISDIVGLSVGRSQLTIRA